MSLLAELNEVMNYSVSIFKARCCIYRLSLCLLLAIDLLAMLISVHCFLKLVISHS